MVDTKNIIIIGKTGSGKSTLANVLSGTKEFDEDDSSLIKSWRTKVKEFKEGETEYRVIDTIGLGDAKLSKEELLEKFEEEIGTYIDEGISQVFFIKKSGRMSEKFLTEFLWVSEFFFDENIFDYITLIRNNFFDFKNRDKCEEEINKLIKFFSEESGKDKEFYEKVSEKILKKRKVVCVDNPSIKADVEMNKKRREKSRKKLLGYLNEISSNEPHKPTGRIWLDKNCPMREKIEELNISEKDLKGVLRLKGFANLKRLNCSNNRLTNLVLSDCKELIELQCGNNKFINLNFLKSVSNLEQLNVSNCHSLEGSLKPLESLNKLEILFITNTNLDKGLECLPKNCKKLVCNSDKDYKSTKIAKALGECDCLEREYSIEYYNLDQWRETDKQNNLAAKVIPLERLFIIRSNLKKFVDKWGVKEKANNNNGPKEGIKKYATCIVQPITWSYNKISQLWKQDKNLSELSKLSHPDDFNKQWLLITGIQWANRATSVVGGSLLLVGTNRGDDHYTEAGGIIAIVAPFVETVTSYLNDQVYKTRQQRWDEFVADTKNMLDSYHELLGILEKIEISKLGDVNQALEELDKAADSFLENYDIDNNETISIFEIIEAKNRKKLAKDLNEKNQSQLYRIVEAMKKLEGEVTKYRQGSTDQTNLKVKSKAKRRTKKLEEAEIKSEEIITEPENSPDTTIDMNEKEQVEENNSIIEVPTSS